MGSWNPLPGSAEMIASYLYIPAILVAVWQFNERSRMERHSRLRDKLAQVPQCVPRSMARFSQLILVSLLLRGFWFFARGTDILGTQSGSSCRSGWSCGEQLVASLLNRMSQTLFFAGFSIIGE
jgi:hypothetical protein